MDETNKTKRITFNNLRLRVYKVIIVLLVGLYFNKQSRLLHDLTYAMEKLLIVFVILAVLGEILKLIDVQREKAALRKNDLT